MAGYKKKEKIGSVVTLRVIFFGTPQVSAAFLESLTAYTDIAAAVTRPDSVSGRGYEKVSSPVKNLAQKKGIPVLQPSILRDQSFYKQLKAFAPVDLGISVAYGKILPKEVFGFPRLGVLNVHFSLLPKYRGAAPMQWALINGDRETGVTTFWMDEGTDTGPIILQRSVKVSDDDDMFTLRDKLTVLGIELLKETFSKIERGEAGGISQEGKPTKAPIITKGDGLIEWGEVSEKILNLVKAMVEWPGAYTHVPDGKMLKVLRAENVDDFVCSFTAPCGCIVGVDKDKGIIVRSSNGYVALKEVKLESKKPMDAWAFWQGARLNVGDVLR